MSDEPVHRQVLDAALLVCGGRRDRTFTLREVVDALPHLNPGTVRTHVASRCCVNAPAHHGTRWPYFKAVARGRYRIELRAGTRHKRTAPVKGWQDRLLEAIPSGVDPTQITERLRLTPTERIERMVSFARFVEDLRRTR